MSSKCESWGKFPKVNQEVESLTWVSDLTDFSEDKTYLPYGLGRSYGDSCLNDNGCLIDTSKLNKLISFDEKTGVLKCEAGASLEDIIYFALPKGWFLPVTPGTKFVTVGGAIANDIHGKNHHMAGTFGCFIRSFELLRSNGERLVCSKDQNSEMYAATIGGMGLTGLILWAEVELKAVDGPLIEMESIQFEGLDEFFEISKNSDKDFEYTVAWLDCVSQGEKFGRGIFMRGNHSKTKTDKYFRKTLPLTVPFNFPSFSLNKYTVTAFNTVYYNKQRSKVVKSEVNFDPFFYPLDMVDNWNRIYGKEGLLQFQCVIPDDKKTTAMLDILKKVVDSGKASFLAVFKEFGDIQSPGLLSFPRPGATLCLDFPNCKSTRKLLLELDELVLKAGGASYPAKDALISQESFKCYYPKLEEFKKYKDPKFSSSYWRRVTGEE